jgi:hypothetical protein
MRVRLYTDDDLINAVNTSSSWKEVYSKLGLTETSSASTKAKIRKLARELNVDDKHFSRNYGPEAKWSEKELLEAVTSSSSLRQVVIKLKSSYQAVERGIEKYNVSVSHINRKPNVNTNIKNELSHDSINVNRLQFAAQSIAQAWFQLRGYDISLPLQPVSYDFLALKSNVLKIQVKTTQTKTQTSQRFIVGLSCSDGRKKQRQYSDKEVDVFFIITSELKMYYVPYSIVKDTKSIVLDKRYRQFEVLWI